MDPITFGVVSTSRKTDERRLPIHPGHLERIDADLRERILLERGYGERFGLSDAQLEPLVGGLCSREQLIADSDVVLLPKPQWADLAELSEGRSFGAGRTACRTRTSLNWRWTGA